MTPHHNQNHSGPIIQTGGKEFATCKKPIIEMESNRSNQNCNVNTNHMFKFFNFPAAVTIMCCVALCSKISKSSIFGTWKSHCLPQRLKAIVLCCPPYLRNGGHF